MKITLLSTASIIVGFEKNIVMWTHTLYDVQETVKSFYNIKLLVDYIEKQKNFIKENERMF